MTDSDAPVVPAAALPAPGEAAAAQPERRTRRSRKLAPEGPLPESIAPAASVAAEPADKPARRSRRAAVSPGVATPDAEPPASTEAPGEPKPRGRRSRPAAANAPANGAAAPPLPETGPPPTPVSPADLPAPPPRDFGPRAGQDQPDGSGGQASIGEGEPDAGGGRPGRSGRRRDRRRGRRDFRNRENAAGTEPSRGEPAAAAPQAQPTGGQAEPDRVRVTMRPEGSGRGRGRHGRNKGNRPRREEMMEPPGAPVELDQDELGVPGHGILEIVPEGWGFLRRPTYVPTANDAYVSQSQIRRLGLRMGDVITGYIRLPRENERFPGLLRVETINNLDPDSARQRLDYDRLTTIYAEEQLRLETGPEETTARFIDLIAPIGKGQRGLIVSPPKAGKTTILKQIAAGIAKNNPEVYLIVLLVDERPEEVTDMLRHVQGQVVSSTFDLPLANHLRVADLVIEQAKRLVECGTDVVILLDSLTRYSRAANLAVPTSGRTLSGGLDPQALKKPKRFFGAARNVEEGGSLTIIATVLVDTGSRMDELIYEEYKGTGNWEVHLSRELQERRIFPAIDLKKCGTRNDERLFDPDTYRRLWKLRKALAGLDTLQANELLTDRLRTTKSNAEFLELVDKTMRDA